MRPIVAFVALVVAGCAASHGAKLVEMSTGCLQGCAQYTAVVHADGFVDIRGDVRRTGKLAPAALTELDQIFAQLSSIDRRALRCDQDDAGTLYTVRYRDAQLSFFDLCPTVADDALLAVGRLRSLLGIDVR